VAGNNQAGQGGSEGGPSRNQSGEQEEDRAGTTNSGRGNPVDAAPEVNSEEEIEKVRNYVLENGVFYDPETGIVTIFSRNQTAEDVKQKLEQIKSYINDRIQEERRNDGQDTIVQRPQEGTSTGETAETTTTEGTEDSAGTTSDESVVDDYLKPRNAEEEAEDDFLQHFDKDGNYINKTEKDEQNSTSNRLVHEPDQGGNEEAVVEGKQGDLRERPDLSVTTEGNQQKGGPNPNTEETADIGPQPSDTVVL
jgi:hypothetical protein